jgi:adenylyltransferase and sulfurtransferase
MDYVQFCGGVVGPINALKPEERVRAKDFDALRRGTGDHVLVDVREKVQFDLCNLEGSINIPWSEMAATRPDMTKSPDPATTQDIETTADWVKRLQEKTTADHPIYVVCRLGNDSQLAVGKMREFGLDNHGARWIGDVVGGLRSWTRDVDREFPEY